MSLSSMAGSGANALKFLLGGRGVSFSATRLFASSGKDDKSTKKSSIVEPSYTYASPGSSMREPHLISLSDPHYIDPAPSKTAAKAVSDQSSKMDGSEDTGLSPKPAKGPRLTGPAQDAADAAAGKTSAGSAEADSANQHGDVSKTVPIASVQGSRGAAIGGTGKRTFSTSSVRAAFMSSGILPSQYRPPCQSASARLELWGVAPAALRAAPLAGQQQLAQHYHVHQLRQYSQAQVPSSEEESTTAASASFGDAPSAVPPPPAGTAQRGTSGASQTLAGVSAGGASSVLPGGANPSTRLPFASICGTVSAKPASGTGASSTSGSTTGGTGGTISGTAARHPYRMRDEFAQQAYVVNHNTHSMQDPRYVSMSDPVLLAAEKAVLQGRASGAQEEDAGKQVVQP